MGKYLSKQISKGAEDRKWKIVTLVRDPIARNISSFFQNLEIILGYNYRRKILTMKTECVLAELLDLFFRNFLDERTQSRLDSNPLTWFDCELKCVFDVDVFTCEFPKTRGYKIYEAPRASVLLLRVESLNECASDAFKEYLDIEGFNIINANVGNEKRYSVIYQKFLDSIVLPKPYINRIYNSKYVRHFYTDQEIDAFKAKWHKKREVVE
jgi:Putative capsular polysaccharide synthesis protein.